MEDMKWNKNFNETIIHCKHLSQLIQLHAKALKLSVKGLRKKKRKIKNYVSLSAGLLMQYKSKLQQFSGYQESLSHN